MAAALFEMRILLSTYSGNEIAVRLAERLAYALHNDALEVLEGDGTFDVPAAKMRIARAEALVGSKFSDGHGLLKG